jgi:hypothetical protein
MEAEARVGWWRRWRLHLLALAAAVAVFLVVDWSRPPEDQWTNRGLLASIDLYQATLSPMMPVAGVHCRFRPTCSHYAEGALRRHGAFKGSLSAAWRLLRCGPWTPAGTEDPP